MLIESAHRPLKLYPGQLPMEAYQVFVAKAKLALSKNPNASAFGSWKPGCLLLRRVEGDPTHGQLSKIDLDGIEQLIKLIEL